jgi:hypothetical protein
LRDERDGRLIVQFGNVAYRTLLDDPEVKKQFTALMKELSTMILKPDDSPQESRPVEKPQPAEPVKPVVPEPAPNVANQPVLTEEVESVVESAKELEEEVVLPGDLPDMTLPDDPSNYEYGRFGRVSVKHVDKAPELNIAQAIEAYLQYKIEKNPQYQRRGIHIKPALGGGVRIEADGKSYDFVDEVADPDVREFIQTAINEWQERH